MKLSSAAQPRRKVEINLVPLLDSIFILIFFFMFALTTMVKRNGLSVALPSAGAGKKVQEKTTLTVDHEGKLFWNKTPFPKTALTERLKTFKAANPEASLVIRGDRNTPFENIVEILDLAESMELRRVTIETQQP